MTIDIETRLAEMQRAFDEAPTGGSSFEEPPAGEYQAIIDSFDVIEVGDRLKFLTRAQVQHHAEHAGKQVTFWHDLEDPERLQYLKDHLHRLGADVESLELATDLRPGSKLLEALLDTPVLIKGVEDKQGRTDKNGRVYVNWYVQQRLGEPVRGDTGDATDFAPPWSAGAGNDDIPF